MRDYEGSVKSLRENAEWADGNIWEVPIMLPDNLRQAADAIEELQKRVELEYQSGFADGQRAANRKKNKWISVKERLPEKSGLYLTYHAKRGSMTMHYSVNNDAWNAFDHEDRPKYALEVTHWMHLPEPPEVKK